MWLKPEAWLLTQLRQSELSQSSHYMSKKYIADCWMSLKFDGYLSIQFFFKDNFWYTDITEYNTATKTNEL